MRLVVIYMVVLLVWLYTLLDLYTLEELAARRCYGNTHLARLPRAHQRLILSKWLASCGQLW